MGTQLRVLSESYPMNTNMTGFLDVFQKSLRSCALDKSSLSIGRSSGTWSVYMIYITWQRGPLREYYDCRN